MGYNHYGRDGKPCTRDEWGRDHEDREKKIVRVEEVCGATVSTVWLGLNHNWGDGPPLIFETMVFGGALDEEMERYSTEAEAIAGHEVMVKKVRDVAKQKEGK